MLAWVTCHARAGLSRARNFYRTIEPSVPTMIKDIAVDDILAALRDARSVTLKPGEILFREGDEAQSMYIVKQGTLRVLSGSTILETVRDGGIIGEMAIIEEHMPRSATVIAGTHCEMVEIDIPRFLSLVGSMPAFSITVLRVISRRLRVMNRRYRDSTRQL
jgi:CRP/FNR family cyclic AMP-dependent transcriptional regulator